MDKNVFEFSFVVEICVFVDVFVAIAETFG